MYGTEEPVPLLVETNPIVIARLDRLAATGFYGPTREAVAEEMLRIALREHETPDFLARREDALDQGEERIP